MIASVILQAYIQFSLSDMQTLKKQQQTAKPVKPVNPQIFNSLKNYENLRKQLYSHFINGQTIKISNVEYFAAYNPPYDLLNSSNYVVINDRKYENMEDSFLSVYRTDLENFSKLILQKINLDSALHSDEFIARLSQWINIYVYFNRWVRKYFLFIQRNSLKAQGGGLHNIGLKIFKQQIFDKIYEKAYSAIIQCLQLFKQGTLREFQPLQLVIKYLGIIGFTKFRLVSINLISRRFQFISSKIQDQNVKQDQLPENPYDTALFKKNFLSRLVKDLRERYTQLSQNALQLSVPEYFQKARELVEIEQKAADIFYAHKAVKDIVVRNVLEVLVVEKAENLLKNSKSGFVKMMKDRDIMNLSRIYKLLLKSNMERVFLKEFQNYIQAQGQVILGRVNAQEERAMKKQTVISVLGEIINFNSEMERIRKEVGEGQAELQKAQNMGFQGFCNAGNRVCNYLAYYADLMLKKDDAGNHNSQQIIGHVSKISKYLYSYDYFVKMHQKLLGLRILYDNFKNQEAEQSLINLFKNQAGLNATSKLSNMISDHKSSEAWNIEFQLKNKFGFGFDVMMLTSGSWQVNDPKCGRSLVPAQLLKAVQQFQSRFLQKMSNRSVSWIFTHGRAIVQLINRAGVKFILVLNNYQLQVLLHIQNGGYAPVKYGDLLTALKIEDEPFFKNSVMNLLKYAVLVKANNTVKIQAKSDELIYNHDFKYKTQKVACIIIPKYTQKANNLTPQINAQRCILIDAALVKIMKQRRRAPYSQVLIQVQKMCKTFKAEISQIKLRIQNCQQRDFIQRDPEDMNILIYKP